MEVTPGGMAVVTFTLLDALFTPKDLGPVLASAHPRPFRSRLRSLLRRGMGGRDEQADEGSGGDSTRNG